LFVEHWPFSDKIFLVLSAGGDETNKVQRYFNFIKNIDLLLQSILLPKLNENFKLCFYSLLSIWRSLLDLSKQINKVNSRKKEKKIQRRFPSNSKD
jgi:hypothetical protein